MTTPFLTQTDRTILEALTTGDKAAGDLLDLSGFKAYPALNEVLNSLTTRGYITSHWGEHRTFRLTEAGKIAIGFSEPATEPANPFNWLPKN